ncbi:MAG TPA: hypothetical protein VGN52_00355 [Burkholderiales bacterium]
METSRFLCKNWCALLLISGLVLQAAPAAAQPASSANSNNDIQAVLTSKKVTIGGDKKEVLIEAKTAAPGDIIEYAATYTNKGKTALKNLTPNLPMPADTEYQAASAKPASGVKASLGDGKYEAIPLKRKVKLPDGKVVEQEVPPAKYRALQWSLGELAPGKSVTVSARVRVSDVQAPAPAPVATPSTGGAK